LPPLEPTCTLADHYWLFTSDTPRQPAHVPLKGLVDGHQDLITSIFSSTPRVQLISAKSDLKLLFSTNRKRPAWSPYTRFPPDGRCDAERGVQFYSGGKLDESGTRKRIHGGSETGPGYPSSSAAFLEFHAPHAAFLHAFPGATDENADTILSSDELYNHWVRLEILHTPVDE
jgi:aldose 1-epimerase